MTRVVDQPEEAGIFTVAAPWGGGTGTLTQENTLGLLLGYTKSAKFVPAATSNPYRNVTPAAGKTILYVRTILTKHQNPGTRIKPMMSFTNGAHPSPDIRISTGGVLQVSWSLNDQQNGPTLTNDVPYIVAMEVDISANPAVIRWRTSPDGTTWTNRTNSTYAVASSTFSQLNFYMADDGPTGGDYYAAGTIIAYGTVAGEHYGVDDAVGVAAGAARGRGFRGSGTF